MAALLSFVLSASWLTGDHAKCNLICRTCPSLGCLLETACSENFTDINFVFVNHITLLFSGGILCKWQTVLDSFFSNFSLVVRENSSELDCTSAVMCQLQSSGSDVVYETC